MTQMIRKITTGFLGLFSALATAATAAAVNSAIPDSPVSGTTAGWIGTGVAAVIWAALQLRRKMSRDGLDMKGDRAGIDMLERAQKERDQAVADARAAWATKNADSLELGQLRAENAYLKEQLRANAELVAAIRRGVQDVGQKVDTVKGRMDTAEKRLTNSGNAPLGEK